MSGHLGPNVGNGGSLFCGKMSPQEVISLLGEESVTRVSSQYCHTSPTDLNGLSCKLALTFLRSGLVQVEVRLADRMTLEESYEILQRFLVQSFGPPDATGDADGGFKYHHWSNGTAEVTHTVIDRFVLAECVVLTCPQ